MSHFIKEIDAESEEFENFLNDEELCAFETKAPEYIEFLKKTGQYKKNFKKIGFQKNGNNRTKKSNKKIYNKKTTLPPTRII